MLNLSSRMRSLRSLVWIDDESRPTAPFRILLISVGSLVAASLAYEAIWAIEGSGVSGLVLALIRPILGYGLPSVAILLGLVFLGRRRRSDWGMDVDRDWWFDFGYGLALATGLLVTIFGVMLVANWVRVTGTIVVNGDPPVAGFLPNLLRILAVFVGVGIYEEFFSRGLLLTNVADGVAGFGPIGRRGAVTIAVGLTAAIFGTLHANNPNASLASTLGLTAAGVLYGTGYVFTGRLALPIGFHIAWNVVEGVVLGFPVSGSREATNLIAVAEQGPDLFTGGAFGPEAGLLGVGARFIGIAAIIAYVRWRHGKVSVAEKLTDPTLR